MAKPSAVVENGNNLCREPEQDFALHPRQREEAARQLVERGIAATPQGDRAAGPSSGSRNPARQDHDVGRQTSSADLFLGSVGTKIVRLVQLAVTLVK